MNGKWTQGSNDGLTFCSDAEFADFISVAVDGAVIDANNYTVKEGSTIVALNAAYLGTLSAGNHTLSINSANGSAQTSFTEEREATTVNCMYRFIENKLLLYLFVLNMFCRSCLFVHNIQLKYLGKPEIMKGIR